MVERGERVEDWSGEVGVKAEEGLCFYMETLVGTEQTPHPEVARSGDGGAPGSV